MMSTVGDTDQRWGPAADAIRARLAELQITKAELARRSGVSDTSVAAYLNGSPIVRADKRRGLAEALGWTADSIDRIERGEPPCPASVDEPTVGQIASEVRELAVAITTLIDKMDEVVEHVTGRSDPPEAARTGRPSK